MRLEWLQDILAVLETGSLSRAAEKRFLTQSAFSRRIGVIEKYAGVELLDRSRKPVVVKKAVLEQHDRIQGLVDGLQELLYELKQKDREGDNQIVIASQHAITISIASRLIKQLSAEMGIRTRLRSANRDECYALLMTKQADMMLIYCSANEQLSMQEELLEQCQCGYEQLIPVCASSELSLQSRDNMANELPVIAYPADVFLGGVMNKEIYPEINGNQFINKKTETALTPAALQLALTGVGIAWIPESLASPELASGKLANLSDLYPTAEFSIQAVRLKGTKNSTEQRLWQFMASLSDFSSQVKAD